MQPISGRAKLIKISCFQLSWFTLDLCLHARKKLAQGLLWFNDVHQTSINSKFVTFIRSQQMKKTPMANDNNQISDGFFLKHVFLSQEDPKKTRVFGHWKNCRCFPRHPRRCSARRCRWTSPRGRPPCAWRPSRPQRHRPGFRWRLVKLVRWVSQTLVLWKKELASHG